MGFLLSASFLYGALIALIIIIAILVELENASWASALVTAAILFMAWQFWDESWNFVSSSPLHTLMYAGGYIFCGVLWSLIKWKRYISSSANVFIKLKENFKKVGPIGENWQKWIDVLNANKSNFNGSNFHSSDEPEDVIEKITMKKSEKKGVIVSWITYWPMSLAATFLNDPFKKFFTWIFDLISGIYDRMAKHEVAGLGDGMHKFDESEQKED